TAGYELAGLHLRRAWRRGFIDPFCRHDLISVKLTVVQKEHSETPVVAQRGLYAAEGRFHPGAVGEPRRIVLHSQWLPDFSRQIVGRMFACDAAHEPSSTSEHRLGRRLEFSFFCSSKRSRLFR